MASSPGLPAKTLLKFSVVRSTQSRGVAPEGLLYRPDFVSAEEERGLLAHAEALEYGRVVLHGVASKREVASFGWRYSFESNELAPAAPIPDWLSWRRDRAAALVNDEPARLSQSSVLRYPPGAGIGYHRDRPVFGEPVIGVSLGGACPMRFQRGKGADREVYVLELAPRSLYAMAGPARSRWEHGILASPSLRYSITFRPLKRPRRA